MVIVKLKIQVFWYGFGNNWKGTVSDNNNIMFLGTSTVSYKGGNNFIINIKVKVCIRLK